MFDVEVHPKHAENGWIYLSFAERLPGYTPPPAPVGGEPAGAGRAGGRGSNVAPSMTTIVRGRINARQEWVDQQVISGAGGSTPPTRTSGPGSSSIARDISSSQSANVV